MKSIITTTFILSAMIITTSLFANTNTDEYQKTASKLQGALENKDYKEAKHSLGDLLPLMKEDIKEFKKTISEAKKSGTDSDQLKQMKQTLKRKSEIYDSLEHLLNVSPAAIRVRARQVVTIVGEYKEISTKYIASL
ncbi:MAG: hypothetical protein AAF551_05495 [Bacteroidota bacterium]